jgi:5'-nucleotidase
MKVQVAEGFVVALDMDTTVYDLMTPWLAWYNDTWWDDLTPQDIEVWDTHLFTVKECGASLYTYLDKKGTFLNLKPFEGAVEAIRTVHGWGVRQVFASTCTSLTGAWEKQKAVDRDFPFIGHEEVLITGGSKDLVRADILFDDRPLNILNFGKSGMTCLVDLQSSPYCYEFQSSPDHVMRSWDEYPEIVATAMKFRIDFCGAEGREVCSG